MKSDPSEPQPAAAPRPALWFVHVASWVLAAMAAVAFLDVVLRIAGRPITGAYELTALLMGLLVYATLPLVTAQDDHVRAGILQMWRSAPKGLEHVLRELRKILSCLALAYLAWALFQYMLRVGAAGDRAPYIEVPLSWVAGFGALSMALSAVMVFWSKRRVGVAP
ncbi:TRAP transporter small permease subunit [Limnohabitans sp.]|uniref:TRAP transporter small permease n=1 Tax=Limnohabitans sp. TaxID=1907725 RepID=UPI0025C491F1|nr:TRAP transporter small permease subunit [Limnohabitans sp.]